MSVSPTGLLDWLKQEALFTRLCLREVHLVQ